MQVCGGSGFWDMKRASCLCVETRRRWATMRERRSSNCTARSACSSFGITARGMRPSLCSQGAARRLQKHRRMHSRATVRPCRCGGAGRNDRAGYRRQECQPRPVSSAEHAHGVAAKLLRCSTRAGHALRRSRQCLDRLVMTRMGSPHSSLEDATWDSPGLGRFEGREAIRGPFPEVLGVIFPAIHTAPEWPDLRGWRYGASAVVPVHAVHGGGGKSRDVAGRHRP